jgi:hypothetical protein
MRKASLAMARCYRFSPAGWLAGGMTPLACSGTPRPFEPNHAGSPSAPSGSERRTRDLRKLPPLRRLPQGALRRPSKPWLRTRGKTEINFATTVGRTCVGATPTAHLDV